ncbi:hypothetical protein [Streptomyces sp. C10-9-1]|uniref:hypothetical protein n=1 Tax=Streptomyces sp. C10-9-1 TaxID=1859285 RepID=UPI003F4A5E8A
MTYTPPARYRHRTAEVEAVQWTGDNADQMRAFCSPFDFQTIDPEDRVEDPDKTAAMRESVHGTWQGLAHGDWAVKIGGRFVVGPAEDFAERYAPAVPVTSTPPTDGQAARRDRYIAALRTADTYAQLERRDDRERFADAVMAVADDEQAEYEETVVGELNETNIRLARRIAELEQQAADRPLSPHYQHPACGFHWHGRDGMDIPIRDGQPVCPRCELAKAEKKLAAVQRRRDEVGAECKRRGKRVLEQHERILALERQVDEVQCQLGAEILRAGQAEAELRRLADETPAGVKQPATGEADPLCICMHRRSQHLAVSGRLLCDACDPDSTENLVCREYTAL